MRALGSGLGCGAISIITDDCPVAVAASVLAYFDRENAGQCGSCFNGTAAMAAVAGALRDGVATTEDLDRLRRWSVVLRGRGACATLDAATNVAASLLDQFPDDVAAPSRRQLCPDCTSGAFRADRPYEVEAVRHSMKIRLDRTVCDGFGICAKHAPGYFSLDDWGYASLIGDGTVAEADRDAVMRALLDCPVHAITEIGRAHAPRRAPPLSDDDDPAAHLKTESNEAEWGFTR